MARVLHDESCTAGIAIVKPWSAHEHYLICLDQHRSYLDAASIDYGHRRPVADFRSDAC